jgi:REP element-mobilizing transposase RayT
MGSSQTTAPGWRTRGYLPHHDGPDVVQHIIFRLADALPRTVVESIRQARACDRLAKADAALDLGVGSRALADPRIASIVKGAVRHFDGERYRLIAWCVMPTHVHVLVETAPGWPTSTLAQAWKSFSAKRANEVLGRSGRFWAPEYFDRTMRDEGEVAITEAYIENNPVVAGLCDIASDWRWSSAGVDGRAAPRGPAAERDCGRDARATTKT